MLDYAYSGKLAIINLLLWLFIVLFYSNRKQSSRSHPLGILVILFATFAFSEADTYHYHDLYDQMLIYHEPIHVESFYFWLIECLPHNYYLWRFIVWGVALFILMSTFKRYKLNSNILGLTFALILLQKFVVTRGCLGIALFICALSLFSVPLKSRALSYTIGVIGVIVSIFLHQSLPIFIAIFILSFVPLNRFTVFVSLILFPVIRVGLIPHMSDFLSLNIFSSDTINFAASYLEDDKSVANVNGLIRQVIELLPLVCIFILLVKEYIFKKNFIDKPMKMLFKYSFVLFYIAMLFFGQQTSSFVSSRTIHMMCFPLMIVVTYYMSTAKKRNYLLNLSLICFFFADIYAFLYTIYKTW